MAALANSTITLVNTVRNLLFSNIESNSTNVEQENNEIDFNTSNNNTMETTAVLPIPITLTTPMNLTIEDQNHSANSIVTAIQRDLDEKLPLAGNDEIQGGESLAYLLIPIILIMSLALLTGVAMYCISLKKKSDLNRYRHRLIPMYSFSPEDENEWGVLINTDDSRSTPTNSANSYNINNSFLR